VATVDALLAFKASLAEDPTCLTGNWNGDDPCAGEWSGVVCDTNATAIIAL
jgi:hypothetical protein